jgi:flavin-dependent trigonelline monooxygenase, reductase component
MAQQVAVANSSGIDRDGLRRALGSFLTGVTIVTALDMAGQPRGITANSFTSVSLDPPLVLVCVDRSAASYRTFLNCRGFAVHILATDQRELSATFAGKSAAKFDGLRTRVGRGGAPVLPRCAAWLDCRTERQIIMGDHVLVIGEVLEFGVAEHRPLGYHQGKYVSLNPELAVADTRPGTILEVTWIAETRDGMIVLRRDGQGWNLPSTRLTDQGLSDSDLAVAASRSLGMPTEVAFLYAIFDRPGVGTLLLAYRIRVEANSADVNAARPGFQCFDAESMPWDEIPDPSAGAMLRRYVTERAGEHFGLYAGSADSGRVVTLAEVDNR